MRTGLRAASIGIVGIMLLAGCSSLPDFTGTLEHSPEDHPLKGSGEQEIRSVPTLSDVLLHIQCEIWTLPRPKTRPVKGVSTIIEGTGGDFAPFWDYQYVLYGVLTLDVTDNGAVDPSLSFIWPATSPYSRSVGLNAQYGDTAHRQITETFILDLSSEGNPTFPPKSHGKTYAGTDELCKDVLSGENRGILGGLGIQQIIAQGIQTRDQTLYIFPFAEAQDDAGKAAISATGAPATVPSFTTTVDFTLTYGVGGSPTWTLQRFAGPTGSAGPLVNLVRTRKDSLVLSFAATAQRPMTTSAEAARAEIAAREPKSAASVAEMKIAATAAAASAAVANRNAADVAKSAATLSILQRLLSGF